MLVSVVVSGSFVLLICGEVLKQLMFVQLRAAAVPEAKLHVSWAAYRFASSLDTTRHRYGQEVSRVINWAIYSELIGWIIQVI
jgi:hypothetical protein